MRIYDVQSAFARGELSPRLHARTDTDHYALGLEECTNWYVLRQGALRKRPGTRYIAEAKDAETKTRLIPFTFSAEQAFVLEFGDQYVRFYANGGRIETGGSPVEIATPYGEDDLFALQYTQSADTLYIAHANHAPRKITRMSDTSWAIAQIAFQDGPYLPEDPDATTTLTLSADGNVIPDMTSNTAPSGTVSASAAVNPAWHAFDRNDGTGWTVGGTSAWLAYDSGSSETVVGYYLQGNGSAPQNQSSSWTFEGYDGSNWIVLDTRRNELGWAEAEWRYYDFQNATAYEQYRINVSAVETGGELAVASLLFKESPATMTAITLTASATTDINEGQGFLASDVGRAIRLLGSEGTYRWFAITARNSATEVTGVLHGPPLVDLNPIRRWQLGAWSEETGYPASVTFFEERLVWARTDTEPQKIWGSKSFGFDDHGTSSPLADDDAFALEIASDQVNEIKWISEATDLLIGTSAAIRTLGPSDTSKAFSAVNLRQRRHTTVGSSAVQPARIGSVTLYADTHVRSLRELFFSLDNDGLAAPELTILSDHLVASGIVEIAHAQSPDSVLWIVTAAGDLVSLTFERDQRIVGMARHRIAGGAEDDQAIVESVATIPGAAFTELWLVVRRTVEGSAVRYVERLDLSAPEGGSGPHHLDSHLVYEGTPAGTVGGLDHLEGETVGIVADGVVVADQVVSGGSVDLPEGVTAGSIVAGLRYVSSLRQLRPAVTGNDGAHLGRPKAVQEVIVDVQDSQALRAGPAGHEVGFLNRDTADLLDQPSPPQSGAFRLPGTTSWRDDAQVSVISDQPLAATVRSITRGMELEP